MSATILVVDDSEVVLGVTRSLLEGAGYRVVTHGRATGCVSLILQIKPDLVLLDVNMPNLSGDSIVKMFESTNHAGGTAIVLHSSLPEADLEKRALTSGAHGYICKTDNAYALLRQIQRWLTQRAAPNSLRGETIPQPRSERTERPTPPGLSKSKPNESAILFVDSDMLTLASYRNAVQAEGYVADFALSANQALNKILSAHPPGLIFVDAELGEPGVEYLLNQVATREPSLRSRIVITASEAGLIRVPAHFSGHILRKPVPPASLCSLVRRSISRSSSGVSSLGRG